jgi:hypothetical protein
VVVVEVVVITAAIVVVVVVAVVVVAAVVVVIIKSGVLLKKLYKNIFTMSLFITHVTQQAGEVITIYTCIRKVLSSSLV